MIDRPASPAALPANAMATTLIFAMASFMQMLDASIIGTALPQMGDTFGVGPVAVGTGIIAYVLAASVVIPASAWIADRFGARRVFIMMMAGFTVASFLCGISTSLPTFVAARVFQGVTGAMMGATGQLILIRTSDRSSLLRLMNIASIPMLVAPVLGPPLGGFLTQAFGWPWIFFINIPIGLIGIGVSLRYLVHLPVSARPFDWYGFTLNAITLSLLLYGVERLSSSGSGSHLPAIAALIAGILTGIWAVRHLQRAEHPILSLAPFKFLTFRIAIVTTMPLIRLPIGALLFVLPIMLQVGFGMTAFLSGIALLAHAGGDLLMKPLMTRTYRKFSYRTMLITSTATLGISIIACGFFTRETSFAIIAIAVFIAGAARSFIMTGLNTLAFDEVPQPMSSSAVTLNQIVIQLAAAFSVALATIFFRISETLSGNAAGQITAEDCRNVLWVMGAIGLLALPALMKLPRDAGDRLSGRKPETATEE